MLMHDKNGGLTYYWPTLYSKQDVCIALYIEYYKTKLELAQLGLRDGRRAEYRPPSVQRRKVWLTPTTRCRAVTLSRS